MTLVRRHDTLEIRTDEVGTDGRLRGTIGLTKPGVLVYLERKDGQIVEVRELVRPDALEDEAFLRSLRQIPVTLEHPKGGRMVTPDVWGELAVGMTGDTLNVRPDGVREAPFTVGRADAIQAAKTTHREASLGRWVKLKEGEGVWNGQRYDREQIGLIADHVALVRKGRAGPMVNVRTDAADDDLEGLNDGDAVAVRRLDDATGERSMKKIRFDNGQEFDVQDDNLGAMIQATLDAAKTARQDADTAKAQLAAKDAEIGTLKGKLITTEAAVQSARQDAEKSVRARLDLEAKAAKHLGDAFKCDGQTDAQIRDALLAKLAGADVKFDAWPEAQRDGALAVLIAQADKAGRTDSSLAARGKIGDRPKTPDQRADADDDFVKDFVAAHDDAAGAWRGKPDGSDKD